MLLSRQEFKKKLAELDLNNPAHRKLINSFVIDEIVEQRHLQKSWEVHGFPPLDCSGTEYLRPCPSVQFGINGFEIRILLEWFAD